MNHLRKIKLSEFLFDMMKRTNGELSAIDAGNWPEQEMERLAGELKMCGYLLPKLYHHYREDVGYDYEPPGVAVPKPDADNVARLKLAGFEKFEPDSGGSAFE